MTTKIKSNFTNIVDTAKLVRQLLKEKFPDCKFSVKTHKYTGGGSINIYYTDYLSSTEIKKAVNHFGRKTYDPIDDTHNYVSSVEVSPNGELVENTYGSDYVFVHREYSENYNWILCNELDLRTKPNLMDQFHNFIKEYSGRIENSSIKVTDKEIKFDLGKSYVEYQLPNSLECLNKQGYKTELIAEENNYKVIIHKI